MTASEFLAARERLNLSRAKFCELIGIAPNSGTAYELGRKDIPRTVALAIAAVLHGLPPVGAKKA